MGVSEWDCQTVREGREGASELRIGSPANDSKFAGGFRWCLLLFVVRRSSFVVRRRRVVVAVVGAVDSEQSIIYYLSFVLFWAIRRLGVRRSAP